MQVTVYYHDGTGIAEKTGYMEGDNPDDCLQKAMDRVKPYATPASDKLRAMGTRDYPGHWTNEQQPADFWDDPKAKRFAGPERPKY
jgi:hypothetical protein